MASAPGPVTLIDAIDASPDRGIDVLALDEARAWLLANLRPEVAS